MRVRQTVIFTLYETTIRGQVESLGKHADSEMHKKVVELTPKVCNWMTVDTIVSESQTGLQTSHAVLQQRTARPDFLQIQKKGPQSDRLPLRAEAR